VDQVSRTGLTRRTRRASRLGESVGSGKSGSEPCDELGVERRITIEDIAAISGLSTATVSRVFALPESSTVVKPATRQKVMQAAAQVGYQPNWVARAFAAGRTNMVGLLYQGSVPILDSIYKDMVATFSDALRQRGHHLMFIPVVENETYWQEMLNAGAVDACVALEMIDQPMYDAIRNADLPAVLLNAGDEFDLPRVMVDDRNAARTLTERLIELGHRRLVFYVNENAHAGHYSIDHRREGFLEALSAHGIDAAGSYFHGSDAALHAKVDARCGMTALVCYSHFEALPLLQHCARTGVRVPTDLSVATFNDIYPVQFTVPPLTTMAIPAGAMGIAGAEMLLAQLDAKDLRHGPVKPPDALSRRLVLGSTLVERESTGPAFQ